MQFRKFAPLIKVNEATREIDVRVTAEATDLAKEKLDWATTRPFIEEYSESVRKVTEELGVDVSLGNVRMQHTPVIGGKFTDITLDDVAKEWTGTIKVKDGEPWEDVMAGHVTGVSIGGEYVKRWDDPDEKGVKRYTARINEVSLVDRPCLKDATFLAVRKDGASEMRKFAPRDDVSQLWDCKNDGCVAKHVKKDDARACLGAASGVETAPPEEVAKISADKLNALSDDDFALPGRRYPIDTKARAKNALARVSEFGTDSEQKKVRAKVKARYPEINVGGDDTTEDTSKAVAAAEVRKSLWTASTLIGALSTLLCCINDEEYEETWEAISAMQAGETPDSDGLAVVSQLKALASDMFDALEALLAEERAELDDDVYGALAMSAVASNLIKSPTAKQLIKSLRVRKGNGSTATNQPKEVPVSTVPETKKEEVKPVVIAPETVAKAADGCNDPINEHVHVGGVCKAEKIDPSVAPVMKAIGGLTAKLDGFAGELGKRDEKIAVLEGAITTLVKTVDRLRGMPAAPIGNLRTVPVEKAADAAGDGDAAVALEEETATPVVKYGTNGMAESLKLMKGIVGGGMQTLNVPPRAEA